MQPESLDLPCWVDLVERRAAERGSDSLYRFLSGGDLAGEQEELTFAGIARRARAIGARLRAAGAEGERVLVLYPPGLGFVEGFYGCMYAGAVAVPAYPPDPTRLSRSLSRLSAIVADCAPRIVLTTSVLAAMAEPFLAGDPAFQGHEWIASDTVADEEGVEWERPALARDSVALLQYTSGSTGSPRGVVVTHGNLLHHARLIEDRLGPGTRGVLWLPPYHDMGLVLGVLQPLYGAWPIALLSPLDFLQRPLRWLEAISGFGATATGAPDFAYDLCARRATDADRARLDLSSLRIACTGAEPVRSATMRRFADAFAPCGFRYDAFDPCYGLAEATLVVTGTRPRVPNVRAFGRAELASGRAVTPHGLDAATELVGCGRPLPSQSLRVVDGARNEPCPDGRVGEIWVAGESVAAGYWRRPEETAAIFEARLTSGEGPYLRTGDLGFVVDGELYLTGRSKDLLVVRGQNHFPPDLEATATGAHPALRPGAVAAFGVERDGAERLVVLAEVDRRWGDILFRGLPGPAGVAATPDALREAVGAAISAHHELALYAFALLPRGSLPKTSSGKLQRHACRELWEEGAVPPAFAWTDAADSLSSEPVYDDVAARLARLDRRATRYQFDLERDVCWERIDEPGRYLGDSFLAACSIDPTRFTEEEEDLFQWLSAVLHAERFVLLEEHLLRFTRARHPALGPTRSLELLEEEEVKHIALFRRYATHLRARRPELAAWLDGQYRDFDAFLERFASRERYPSEVALHYAFWLGILFFEEYTVYVFQHLAEDAERVQPTWLAAHKAHRQEEVQHILTDFAYVQALRLTDEERFEWSRRLFDDLSRTLAFMGPGDDLALCEQRFPGLRERVHSRSAGPHVFTALLRSKAFARTRAAGPYFAYVAERPLRVSRAAPEAVEVERRWLREWLATPLRRHPDAIDTTRAFAEQGLDSVTLIALSGELERRHRRRLPATLAYDYPTVDRLAEHVAGLPAAPDTPPPPPPIRPGPLPVSARQERLCQLERTSPGAVIDHVTQVTVLEAEIPAEAARRALATLAARHEPLRARFCEEGEGFAQHVDTSVGVALDERTVTGDWRAAIHGLAAEQDAAPFDLAVAPLWRATLVNGRALILTLHHLVTDGWSMEILWRELAVLLGATTAPGLSPLRLQQADVAARERAFAATAEHRARLDWWRERLAGHPWLSRPTGPHARRCASISRTLDAEASEAAEKLARRHGGSLYIALLTAFHLALIDRTGQPDVLVNTHLFNRFTAEEQAMVGYFVNLLTLRPELRAEMSFAEAAQRVRIAWMEALENEVSIDRLVGELAPERYAERFMPSPVAFNLLPRAADDAPGLVRMNQLAPPPAFLFFEQMLLATATPGRLGFTLWYDPARVGLEQAETFLEAFLGRLAVVSSPARRERDARVRP